MLKDITTLSNEELSSVIKSFYRCAEHPWCRDCPCEGVVCGVTDIADAREAFALECAKRLGGTV